MMPSATVIAGLPLVGANLRLAAVMFPISVCRSELLLSVSLSNSKVGCLYVVLASAITPFVLM